MPPGTEKLWGGGVQKSRGLGRGGITYRAGADCAQGYLHLMHLARFQVARMTSRAHIN